MNFKSLFFEEDLSAKKAAPPVQSTPSMNYSAQQVPAAFPVSGPDPEIRAALLQSINEKKLPSYDYLKFVATLEEMKPMIPAEDARFKMAFIAAKQSGVDKVKLAETGQHYIQVLNEDAAEFKSNLDSKIQEAVTAPERHLAEIDAQITARQTQIQQLNAEILAASTERANLASQIADTKYKLESKKKSFEVTHAGCVAEIEGNIQKINQYLQ